MNFKMGILAALLVMTVCASFLIGCNANTETRVSVGSKTGDAIVTFPDPNFEAVIREAIERELYKTSESIYQLDLEKLTHLAVGPDVSDITGLEYCTNLTDLFLLHVPINETSSFSNLRNLTRLWISGTDISDISLTFPPETEPLLMRGS